MRRPPEPNQSSLFGDDLPPLDLPATSTVLDAIAVAGTGPLPKASAQQQAFRRYVTSIETCKQEIAAWEAYQLTYSERLHKELAPLERELDDGQRRMAFALGELLGRKLAKPYPKAHQRKLVGLLLDALAPVMDGLGDDDPDRAALIALHDKYADTTFAEIQAFELQAKGEMLREMFGVQVTAEDLRGGDEALASKFEAFVRQEQQREQAREQARLNRKERRQAEKLASSPKAAAAAAAKAAAEKQMTQSLREVYRKLASAMHPDREPDEQARVRKTELMQQVNKAYEAQDMLALLNLQMQADQLDTEGLLAIDDERLRHYNQFLSSQLKDLKETLMRLRTEFALGITGADPQKLSLKEIDTSLTEQIKQMRDMVATQQARLADLQDPERMREVLRVMPLPRREPEDADMLAEMIASLQAAHAEGGRRGGGGGAQGRSGAKAGSTKRRK